MHGALPCLSCAIPTVVTQAAISTPINHFKKERKKNAEAWISGSGSVVHPTPQESQGVTADRQVEQVGEDEQRN